MTVVHDQKETIQRLWDWVSLCQYPEYTFTVHVDGRGAIYLHASYDEGEHR